MLITSLNPVVNETLKELKSLKSVFASFICLIMIASKGMMTFDTIGTIGPDLKLSILVGWDRSFRLLLGPPGLN